MLLTGPFGGLTDDVREFLLCPTALAPLAMLGALDVPARMSPSPSWFALTGTAPAWSRTGPPWAPSSPAGAAAEWAIVAGRW